MKLCIIGYGKMGKTIERLAPRYGFTECVIIDNEEDWLRKQDASKSSDVAIEFSTPQTVRDNLSKCFERKLPVVSGTTGWNEFREPFMNLWEKQSVSFIYGSNFSIGAHIFFKLNVWLAQQMKWQSQYTVSIEETHHIHKKDAPSGTALIIQKDIQTQYNHKQEIFIKSHREGEVVGEHIVNYESAEDSIQIKHDARSRDIFAHGALKAAVWLLKHPGIYDFGEIFSIL